MEPSHERIARVEQQRRLGRHVRRAANSGDNLVAVAPVRRLEDTTDDAFLPPDFAFIQLTVSREAGDLRAGAGTARRAIVCEARTEHEVATLIAANRGRTIEFDVIDLGAAFPCDAICRQRVSYES